MDATEKPGRPLSAKQLAFCREFRVDRNATQAAIRVKYSEAHGRKLLRNDTIKAEIARLDAEDLERAGGRDSLILELARIAFRSYRSGERYYPITARLRALENLCRIARLYPPEGLPPVVVPYEVQTLAEAQAFTARQFAAA